jgi:mono/diheme cytochrome c family protein
VRAAAIVCVCAAGGACSAQVPASERAGVPDAAQIYARACARCHALDGSGGLPMAPGGPRPTDFRDSAWQASRSDAQISSAIQHGFGAMPPFGELLKPAEIEALTVHLRGLGSHTK